MKSKFNDQLFRKLFMSLVTLALMLIFVLSTHLFFSIPINSKPLWMGSAIVYVTINLIIDMTTITKKIIVLGISSIIMGAFFSSILHWPLGTSLLSGMTILIFCGLMYLTFLH